LPGFGIRLREGGSRTWLFRYRIGKKQRAVKLGSAKTIPLVVARKNAKKLAGRVVNGEDPALDREIARSEAENTFGVLANQFLEARKSSWRPRTHEEIRRHLIKKSKSLHSLPVTAISQRNIANLLAEVTKSGGPIESNRLRASLSTLFSWIMREGIRLPEGNPAANTNKNEERSRDRVFTDAELRAIWNACLGDDYGAVVKLLMLTGQRANEISALRWNEVHDEQIILPGERTKNHRIHIVPLSEPAKAILAGFRAADREFVFGLTDVRGFCGWSAAKDNLNARVAASGSALPHWTPHDLRRTVATRMADLGVQPHIIEAVLNHVSGHKGGVAGIYNRATYDREKREALNLWAEHVTALVEGRKATVVPMKRTNS
jgi:integrase